jgi:hypothetical protein
MSSEGTGHARQKGTGVGCRNVADSIRSREGFRVTKRDEKDRAHSRLRRAGLWTALILLAALSLTVFAVCACKSLG